MNNFLEFYEQHRISPVSQDISNLDKHFNRRMALYRQLGIPPLAFRGARVLEVGPGSGHNSIVTASFSPAEYVLIEPNPTGFSQLKQLFGEFNFQNISSHNCLLENFKDAAEFDIVLCEGLIPGLDNKEAFLEHLVEHVNPGGILVITCYDAISMFFETCRRIIATELIEGVSNFDEKVRLLSDTFRAHLLTLKGMSRTVEDWVIDNLLAPPVFNAKDYFSLGQALEFFGQDFYFYQTSPSFLPNYAWYKELPSDTRDYNQTYLTEFSSLRHNLLHYKSISTPRNPVLNIELESSCKELALVLAQRNEMAHQDYHASIMAQLKKIELNVKEHSTLIEAVMEASQIIEKRICDPFSIANQFTSFRSAFGRGQQYLSLIKKD